MHNKKALHLKWPVAVTEQLFFIDGKLGTYVFLADGPAAVVWCLWLSHQDSSLNVMAFWLFSLTGLHLLCNSLCSIIDYDIL